MKFFTREATRLLRTEKGAKEWDKVCKRYNEHLKHIRPSLSKGWKKVAATNFHDSHVFSFGQLDDASYDSEFIINIDMNPCWKRPPLFICSLHFYRVRNVVVPVKVLEESNYIVYEEVHVTSKGAREWRALLRRGELRIEAEDVAFSINHQPLL